MKRLAFILLLVLATCLPANATRIFTSGCENDLGEWSSTSGVGFTTSNVHSGTYACRVVHDGGINYFQKDITAKSSGSLFHRFYYRPETLPTGGDGFLAQFRDSGDGGMYRMSLTTAGNLKIYNDYSGGSATTTATLSVNTQYRIEWKLTIHNTAGVLEAKLFADPESTTPTETITISGVDTLGTSVVSFRIGIVGFTTTGANANFDDVALNDETGGSDNDYPGPLGASKGTIAGAGTISGAGTIQ